MGGPTRCGIGVEPDRLASPGRVFRGYKGKRESGEMGPAKEGAVSRGGERVLDTQRMELDD
ncbi:hypothetical protein LINPERHAP1_LOCUS38928 [Linum perenne]